MALVLGTAAAAWLTRQPGYSVLQTLYYEDSQIFLQQADQSGPGSILQSYAGYVHLVPRLIALLTTVAPLSLAPAVLALGSAAVVGWCMWTVWITLRDQPGLTGRVALPAAVGLAVVPVASGETIGSVGMVHWYLLAASIAITALGRMESKRGVPAAALLAAAALSDPLTVVALPGAIRGALQARSRGAPARAGWLPAAALSVALGLQALAIVTLPGSGEPLTFVPPGAESVTASALLIGPLALLGKAPTYGLVGLLSLPVAVAFLGCMILVAVALVVWRRAVDPADRSRWSWSAALLLLPGAAVIVLSVLVRSGLQQIAPDTLGGYRYPVPLGYAYTVLVVAALSAALTNRHWAALPMTTAVAVSATVLVVCLGWATNVERASGPLWAPLLATACAQAGPGNVVTVPAIPEGWTATVRCR